jgi:hypothetical protein
MELSPEEKRIINKTTELTPEEKIIKLEFTIRGLQNSIVTLVNNEHHKDCLNRETIEKMKITQHESTEYIKRLESQIKELTQNDVENN